jgi:small subunit ribosomal protein S19e
MVSIHDVNPQKLIEAIALQLEKNKELAPPEWIKFVKTGSHKERPPEQKNWWYLRSAAILRSVAINGPVGVSKLRSKYGGKKNRGSSPEKFRKGSGNIIRKILQQLEKAELIKYQKDSVRKGRVIAPKGMSLLNKTAAELHKKPTNTAK